MRAMARAVTVPGNGGTPRPSLELSGPKLARALESLVVRTEEYGGVERYVEALKVKMALFGHALGEGRARAVEPRTLRQLLSLLATVRRRVGPYLQGDAFESLRAHVADLLDAARDTAAADDAVAQFCAHFPGDREHRWVRDLAAEVLHNVDPERYPLMSRWVWDARANTGVLREIWHAEDVDHITIHVPDGHATFVVLREELSQYLTTNGVYRDVLQYVDLLTAQVYAEYITEQGGSYLRSDFAQPQDPMLHTRRMLGLDIAPDGRSKLKAVDGDATIVDPPRLAN
jgi:hypothetical protein